MTQTTEPAPAVAGRFELIDPQEIAFSETNTIYRSAEEFLPSALKELADSMAVNGLAQPILVRPNTKDRRVAFILVAGERRLRAWRILGNSPIPAYIRELTEAQALELQVIENSQRENVNPMREAMGFAAWMKSQKVGTRHIADKIGKSIDYVQERLRLVELIPEIQDLVRKGDIPIKAGLKMARIPKELQPKALSGCTEKIYMKESPGTFVGGKEPRTVFSGLAQLQEWMDNNLWTNLGRADFDTEDTKLNPPMGACSTCQHRAANTGGLFNDITHDDRCLLSSCFRQKQINTYKNLKADLVKKYPGREVVFRMRDNGIDAREVIRKGLGEPLKSELGGVRISEKELKKNSKATVQIYVGTPNWNEKLLGKKYDFFKPHDVGPRSIVHKDGDKEKVLTPADRLKREQQIKDAKLKDFYQEAAVAFLTVEDVMKDRVPLDIQEAMRWALRQLFEYSNAIEKLMAACKYLGVDLMLQNANKPAIRIPAKKIDLGALFADTDQEIDVDATIEEIPGKLLPAFFLVAQLDDYYAAKDLKIDAKAIRTKAAAQTSSWWSKILAERKVQATIAEAQKEWKKPGKKPATKKRKK